MDPNSSNRPLYITSQVSQDIFKELLNGQRSYKGAYKWWFELPVYQQRKFLFFIRHSVSKNILNDSFKSACFKACLNNRGLPTVKGIMLYKWMREKLYANKTDRMYRDWLRLALEDQDNWILPKEDG